MTVREVDEYLAGVDSQQRATLETLRRSIAAVAPHAEQGLSYGAPAFRIDGKVVAGFSAAKRHLSYLPHSGSLLGDLPADVLAGYTWSKGALQFPSDAPLPHDLVATLVHGRLAELGME